MKLTKNEKEVLKVANRQTLHTMAIDTGSEAVLVSWKLVNKDLLECRKESTFGTGVVFFTLTEKGIIEAKKLKMKKKTSKVKKPKEK